jgi:hypothetical protein
MAVIDARPFLRASDESLWAAAERAADELVLVIKDELARRNINAAVTRSPNGTHPTVVRMDAWVPPGVTSATGRTVRRISLSLTTRILPFNRKQFAVDAGVSRDGREYAFPGLLNFGKDEARRWIDYALGKSRRNPRASEASTHALLSMFGLAMLSPRHNPIDREFRNGFPPPIPVALFWLGVLLIVIGFLSAQSGSDYYGY